MAKKSVTIIGIDYGAKLAGTTVLAISQNTKEVTIISCRKNEDADAFILQHLKEYPNGIVCIDAPLSLPLVYAQPEKTSEYFYRKCDKLLQAMSPMFLGGLTARAMQLKAKSNLLYYEVYPAALANELALKTLQYKKEKNAISIVSEQVLQHFKIKCAHRFTSWHEVDALLALSIGLRIQNKTATAYGDAEEGIIWV
jgi:predicted nuclease with RNAse H fold